MGLGMPRGPGIIRSYCSAVLLYRTTPAFVVGTESISSCRDSYWRLDDDLHSLWSLNCLIRVFVCFYTNFFLVWDVWRNSHLDIASG